MNARCHGLASLLEGALPETCLDVEALSDRLSQIETERLRLYRKSNEVWRKEKFSR
jgi:hypothetical protein